MIIRIKKPKSQDIIFWISYALFLIFGILSTSFYYKYFIGTPYSIIKYLCIGLLFFRELTIRKYNIQSLLIGLVFVALVLITRSQASVSTVAFILIYVFCARNVEFEDIAWFSIWISSITVAFIIVSAQLGIIQDYIYSSAARVRHYLGFRYALFGPTFLFNITGLVLYVKKAKIKWKELAVLVAINWWMFVMTNSRLSFYLSVLMVFLFGVLKVRPNFFAFKRVLCWGMVFAFVLSFVVSVYFTVTYNPGVEWKYQLNTVLGGRLRLGQSSLLQSGISLFGQKVEMVGNGLDAFGNKNINPYNYVDSFYIQILQRYGIIFSIVWIAILTFTLYCSYKINDYYMMICLVFIAGHCIIDDLSLSLYYNTFWFAGSIVMKNWHGVLQQVKPQKRKRVGKICSVDRGMKEI